MMPYCGYCGYDVGNPCLEASQAEDCSEALETTSTVSPDYYARWKISPIDFIQENNLSYAEANVIKYIMRHDAKNGAEDLDKALTYIEMIRHRDYKDYK